MNGTRTNNGFTLIELLCGIFVLGLLASLVLAGLDRARFQADKAASMQNIRQLVTANQLYAAERGHFAPWGNMQNNIRWHSARISGEFDAQGGYLSPYLGNDERVRRCPVFEKWNTNPEGSSFDEGAGGYGYNSTYIGGRPSDLGKSIPPGASRGSYQPWWAKGNLVARVDNPTNVVMFASSAIARGGGLVETDQAVPYRSLTPGGLGENLTPTVHFRFSGKALVAWADGHVSLEPPNEDVANGWSVYGEDNDEYKLGWFGPTEWNGYWNPRFEDEVAY